MRSAGFARSSRRQDTVGWILRSPPLSSATRTRRSSNPRPTWFSKLMLTNRRIASRLQRDGIADGQGVEFLAEPVKDVGKVHIVFASPRPRRNGASANLAQSISGIVRIGSSFSCSRGGRTDGRTLSIRESVCPPPVCTDSQSGLSGHFVRPFMICSLRARRIVHRQVL